MKEPKRIITQVTHNWRQAEALAALDTLAAEPSEDARGLARKIWKECLHDGGFWNDEAAALIEADRQKVLEECADKAIAYCRQFEGFFEGEDDIGLRAAIMDAGEE